jgi:hypothetical protein
MSKPEQQDAVGGTQWDAPNQQVVRDDASAPWEEGTGGETTPPGTTTTRSRNVSLDEMTKDELLEYAQQLGVSPANAGMTKDELRAGVDAKQAEGG